MRLKRVLMLVLFAAVMMGSIAGAEELLYVEDAAQAGNLSGQSGDQLFYAYLKQQVRAESDELVARGTVARETLSGLNLVIYDQLRAEIVRIASGERTSTEMEISLSDAGIEKTIWTSADLGTEIVVGGAVSADAISAMKEQLAFDAPAIVRALMSDCPYDMYWFDKTKGYSYGYGGFKALWQDGQYVLSLEGNVLLRIYFTVAGEYQESEVAVSETKIARMKVAEAVSRARTIVRESIGKQDIERLYAYRNAICQLVSYNDAAADASNQTPYGNPWQLIYVFDGDESTNVVCEGYAKAFQFLCDVSSFRGSIRCYSVTGTMSGGSGAGPHMWNLLRMDDGKSYVADITNCDTGSIGATHELFLKGMTAENQEGSSYFRKIRNSTITYAYDTDTMNRWSMSILKPSETDYDISAYSDTDAWLAEWNFELGDGVCILKKQKGTARDVQIPATARINEVEYPVVMESGGRSPFNSNVTSIEMHGVKFTGNCALMFADLSECRSIIAEVDTAEVTDMSSMFVNCSALTELDLISFDTSNVTAMPYMFRWCSALEKLDLSSFDTRKTEDMEWMFGQCEKLTELNLSAFFTPNLIDMAFMFDGCTNLRRIDMSNMTTAKVETMYGTFRECKKLEEITRGFWDTANVTSMYQMFYRCNELRAFDVSGFATSKVRAFGEMFEGCSKLEVIDVSGFDTSAATNMYRMFSGCQSVKVLDVSGFDTSKAVGDDNGDGGLEYMFSSCGSLTELDVSGFDTSKATSMEGMFSSCSGLTELDVSGFNTANVTSMRSMFSDCRNLTSLDVSGFDTSNVMYMDRMFDSCMNIRHLDVSGFDTKNVTNMDYMFLNFDGFVNVGKNVKYLNENVFVRNLVQKDLPWYSAVDRTWYTPAEAAARSNIADVYLTNLDILEYAEPEYTWDSDYSRVTATSACVTVSLLDESETVETTMTETAPTCTKDGAQEYTAAFTNHLFHPQTATMILPALGHGDPVPSVTPATKQKDGLITGVCPVCGEEIGERQIIHHTRLLVLPEGTKRIEEEAFAGCAAEQITIGKNATAIGARAFAGCDNLLAILIPAGVRDIAEDAFAGNEEIILVVETDEAQNYCVRNGLAFVRAE